MGKKEILQRIDLASYRLDRVFKTGIVAGFAIWFAVYAFGEPGIAPKVVAVVTLLAAIPLTAVVWRALGRFYELEDK